MSTTPDAGMVFLAPAPDAAGRQAPYQALSFGFTDDRLRLGELRLSVPPHRRGPRGAGAFARVRATPVSFGDDGALSLSETRYVADGTGGS